MFESFVLQLYGSRHDTLGAARLDKFKKFTDNDLRLLPLSKEALHQHIYCASYQVGYLWRQCVEELDIPDPEQRGWETDSKGNLQPLWTTSQSSFTVKNFIETCSCKTRKCKSCKCARANDVCLSICGCGRGCIWTLYYSCFKFLFLQINWKTCFFPYLYTTACPFDLLFGNK